jgi:hypothetical protein
LPGKVASAFFDTITNAAAHATISVAAIAASKMIVCLTRAAPNV